MANHLPERPAYVWFTTMRVAALDRGPCVGISAPSVVASTPDRPAMAARSLNHEGAIDARRIGSTPTTGQRQPHLGYDSPNSANCTLARSPRYMQLTTVGVGRNVGLAASASLIWLAGSEARVGRYRDLPSLAAAICLVHFPRPATCTIDRPRGRLWRGRAGVTSDHRPVPRTPHQALHPRPRARVDTTVQSRYDCDRDPTSREGGDACLG